MPGFTSECMTGKHKACAENDCRCECHQSTQELLRKQVVEKPRGPKAVPRGRGKRVEERRPSIEATPATQSDLQNTCESCGKKHPSTKNFCTDCGARLCLGQYCQRCEAPCDALDKFCGECGWNMKAAMPAQEQPQAPVRQAPPRLYLPSPDEEKKEPTPLPPGIVVGPDIAAEPAEPEDPLAKIIREAEAQGLKPTFGVSPQG